MNRFYVKIHENGNDYYLKRVVFNDSKIDRCYFTKNFKEKTGFDMSQKDKIVASLYKCNCNKVEIFSYKE